MGYQALLFCPDEKTARTVTQVLSELEFNVESCMEPFAAVKKLMGQHFDAVVVDCDNEQNATLLFKSARNSTSNQASLAVAVVEGQAGVAKAFRIGANLVLTKPINIEQAKGTLRVARGLLRKGEPAKPAALAPPTPAPAKPVAAKAVPPLKSGVPFTPAAVPTSLPVAPPAIKPATASAWPAAAVAGAAPAAKDGGLANLNVDAPVPVSSAAAIVESALSSVKVPDSPPAKLPAAVVPSAAAEVKIVSHSGLSATPVSGAASAPAPAREVQDSRVAELSPVHIPVPVEAEPVSTQPVEALKSESSSYVGSEPSFTFGGANVAEKSGGGSKKILLGVAAAVLVAAALYFGWTEFHGTASPEGSTQTQTTPSVPVPETVKPSSSQPVPTAKPSASAPTTAASVPNSQPDAVPTKSAAAAAPDASSDDYVPAPGATKPSGSAVPAASKPAEAPLMVKAGKAPVVHAKPAAPDTPAPDMSAIATAGAGAPPPNLGSGAGTELHPVLQTLHISQGVSQGLLIKKVQPVYPRNALFMHLEGSVELMATISKSGDISHVKVLSGDSQLTRAASDAVKQWKYKPYLLNGEPVEIQTQVTINFKLPK
jgi:periplasmic protein TonB